MRECRIGKIFTIFLVKEGWSTIYVFRAPYTPYTTHRYEHGTVTAPHAGKVIQQRAHMHRIYSFDGFTDHHLCGYLGGSVKKECEEPCLCCVPRQSEVSEGCVPSPPPHPVPRLVRSRPAGVRYQRVPVYQKQHCCNSSVVVEGYGRRPLAQVQPFQCQFGGQAVKLDARLSEHQGNKVYKVEKEKEKEKEKQPPKQRRQLTDKGTTSRRLRTLTSGKPRSSMCYCGLECISALLSHKKA